MSVQLAITFSSLLVENKHLIALYQRRNYFANYLCAFYSGQTYGNVSVFVNQQNFLKLNCRTGFSALHVVNKQFFASFCLKLLALDFYNCVHLI